MLQVVRQVGNCCNKEDGGQMSPKSFVQFHVRITALGAAAAPRLVSLPKS